MRPTILGRLASLSISTFVLAAPLKVGMVTDVGGIDDKSFNQAVWEGLERFAWEYGLKPGRDLKALPSTGEGDYVANLDTLVDEGFDLIVAPGYLIAGALYDVAARAPGRKFLSIDSVARDPEGRCPPNVACVNFEVQEGSFLVGVAAGLKARSAGREIVGFVGGMDFPLIHAFQAGYEQGVRAVLPRATVLVDYAGGFADPRRGRALAARQYGAGAYVVFHAAGATGSGVIQEAMARSRRGDVVWAIGADRDQYRDGVYAPGQSAVLTSMVKRVDVAAHDLAAMAAEGRFPGGEARIYSLRDRGVGLPAENPNLSRAILAEVEEYKARILAGEIVVQVGK